MSILIEMVTSINNLLTLVVPRSEMYCWSLHSPLAASTCCRGDLVLISWSLTASALFLLQ